jgi:hypothetical protein
MEVTQFEKAIEEYLRTQKYFAAVGEAAEVTSEELLNAYLEGNREVELAWLAFEPAGNPAPAREAVARYFQEHKGEFKLPAKAQIEFLLAEREKYVGEIEAPSEADIKTYYEGRKTVDFKNPGGGKDGKPEFKPLEGEVRDQIVQELKKQRAALKAAEILQKLLSGKDGIGDIEAKMKKDPSVRLDFAALAAKHGVTHVVSHFIPETQVDDLEKLVGSFRDTRDRDSFRRKIFQDMNDGEVMRGEQRVLATDKGSLIYRLVVRKKERTPDQLTADVEEEIVARLRKEAQDRKALEEVKRAVDLVNGKGLAAAEAELHRVFNRPPALKSGMPLPDPEGGEHGRLAEGGAIVNLAFTLRAGNQVGKAQILDPGPSRTKYAVVLQRALEAKMEDFEAQKGWLRDKLMKNDWQGNSPVPGKRQQLIDARRAELEKGIVRMDAKPASDAPPVGGPMPPPAAPAAGSK